MVPPVRLTKRPPLATDCTSGSDSVASRVSAFSSQAARCSTIESGVNTMDSWQPTAYKQYQWIVADPQLLGGKLAIRGTRLGVSLILECLASGMSLDDIDQSFGGSFPRQALPEVLKVASEITDSFHVAA